MEKPVPSESTLDAETRTVARLCTDHQRAATAGPVTVTRVPLKPLAPAKRWSRRHVLLNVGLGTAGIAVLAACGSDSSSGSGPSTPASARPTDEPPTSEAPATNGPSSTETGAAEATSGDGELQLQHVSLGFVSAYVLVRGSEAAIVDTGVAGSGDAIGDAVTAAGLTPADVRHSILTHNHGDHIGGLGELEVEMTNATVYAGPGDVDTIQTSLALNEVDDGDEIFGMGVVATPGHTPGSISVFDTGTGLLVAGDAINGDGEGGLTGANPDFTPDMSTASASVATLAALMPATVAFGHGGPPVTEDVATKLAALV